MFDHAAVPEAAKPKDQVTEINRVGKQEWSRSGPGAAGRYCTIQFFIPDELDWEAEWAAAVTPLIAKGMTMQETARQDIAAPLPDNVLFTVQGSTHYRVENRPIELEPVA